MDMTIDQNGNVALKKTGWRGSVGVHDQFTLDALGGDLTQEQLDEIATAWAAAAPAPDPEPSPEPPTSDELFTFKFQNDRVFKAFWDALNDGSLPVGQSISDAAAKAAVKAKM